MKEVTEKSPKYNYGVEVVPYSEGAPVGQLVRVTEIRGRRAFQLYLPWGMQSTPMVRVFEDTDGVDLEFARAFLEPLFPYGYEHLVEQSSEDQLLHWLEQGPPAHLTYISQTLDRLNRGGRGAREEYETSIRRRREWARDAFRTATGYAMGGAPFFYLHRGPEAPHTKTVVLGADTEQEVKV